jgi:hypothetical protein
MLQKVLVLGSVVLLSMGVLSASAAEYEHSAVAQASTVVIYRAGELSKTSRVRLNMHIDEGSIGRLKPEDSIVLTGSPGSYTLDSSIADTQPLVIDLKPGAVHYVHADVEIYGNRVRVKLIEVEEQVAKVQQPSLDSAI